MRIACPECNAAYDVPASQLAPGRPARCARCGAVWTPVATEDARPPIPVTFDAPISPPAVPPSSPEPVPVLPEPTALEPAFDDVPDPVVPEAAPPQPVRRRKGVPVLVGWLLSAFVLVVFTVLAVARRDAIMEAWPPAGRAYHLVGLSH